MAMVGREHPLGPGVLVSSAELRGWKAAVNTAPPKSRTALRGGGDDMDFTPKRETLERSLQDILDRLRLLGTYVDEKEAFRDILGAVGAIQFCYTEEEPWPFEVTT